MTVVMTTSLTADIQLPGEPVRCSGDTQRGTMLRPRWPVDPTCVQRTRDKTVCERQTTARRHLPLAARTRHSITDC